MSLATPAILNRSWALVRKLRFDVFSLVPVYLKKQPIIKLTGARKSFYKGSPEYVNSYQKYPEPQLPRPFRKLKGEEEAEVAGDLDERREEAANVEENDEDLKAFIGRSKSTEDNAVEPPLIRSKPEERVGSKRMMPLRALDAIYRSHKFPNEPDSKEVIDRFDAPTRIGYQYGQLIWGWFIAPLDGEYVFYSACDDACDIYMSPDEGKDHIRKIISQNRWSLHNQWDK